MADDWAGTDFRLDTDLGTSNQGDYVLVSNNQNVDAAVLRRLMTPLGALFYDETYGNPVYDILGDPMDGTFAAKAEQGLSDCLQYEDRINVISIDVVTTNEQRRAQFFIVYSYNNNSDLTNTVQGVITDAGLSVQNGG
ncbi:hypothetical protein PP175_05660 [Aneurinibacillus sp. Ricciae_BoGa-3]|uniref:hypothetical protein n=1 Tax=Aneurinibacillus sp. Ricciae_BoGa-3 TaxID=3022697 RepID=UPI0023424503|nr:hypothetical protein [Aneurinibacillus sp. Ricciae_BoGa-3]WCK55437.1 hypothetical protein PP175_05660 [Aneurinibacillus sp. Ricciae_BoGa-3]